MQGGEKLTLDQIRALLAASQEVRFTGHSRKDIYDWVGKTMREHDYAKQGREGKGLLRSYVAKMTGQSRAQVTRLIGQYLAKGEVKATVYRRRRFPVRYTRIDTACLAAVDEAHGTMSGPATRKILEREFGEYGKGEYERLAGISVAHLYRLRKTKTYRIRQATFTKTKPTPVVWPENSIRRIPSSTKGCISVRNFGMCESASVPETPRIKQETPKSWTRHIPPARQPFMTDTSVAAVTTTRGQAAAR